MKVFNVKVFNVKVFNVNVNVKYIYSFFILLSFVFCSLAAKATEYELMHSGVNGDTLEVGIEYPSNLKYTSDNNVEMLISTGYNKLTVMFEDGSYRLVFFDTKIVRDVSKPSFNPDPLPPEGGIPLSITPRNSTNKVIEYALVSAYRPTWDITTKNKHAYDGFLALMEDIGNLGLLTQTPERFVLDNITSSLGQQQTASACEFERGMAAIGYNGYSNKYRCSMYSGLSYLGVSVGAITTCLIPAVNLGFCAAAAIGATAAGINYIDEINQCELANLKAQNVLDNCETKHGLNTSDSTTNEPSINLENQNGGGGFSMTCNKWTSFYTGISGSTVYGGSYCSGYTISHI